MCPFIISMDRAILLEYLCGHVHRLVNLVLALSSNNMLDFKEKIYSDSGFM